MDDNDLGKKLQTSIRAIKEWYGNVFWALQWSLGALVISGTMLSLIEALATKNSKVAETAWKTTQLWLISLLVLPCLCYVLRKFNLDLRFYYNLWLPHIKPKLTILTPMDEYVIASRKNDYGRASFVRRKDLMRKDYWHGWDFAIVTLFSGERIRQTIATTTSGKQEVKQWILDVNLQGESYGIYSNTGKEFLRTIFQTPENDVLVAKKADQFFAMTSPDAEVDKPWTWDEHLPMRWADGGMLPVVYFKDSRYAEAKSEFWALLFFRDIHLVGLNLATGASENKQEYKDLKNLLVREFIEEVVILDGKPRPKRGFTQQEFQLPDALADYGNPAFTKKQRALRDEADQLSITPSAHQPRPVRHQPTNFSVKVTYDGPNNRPESKDTGTGMLYSLNPVGGEFGIEAVWLGVFRLGDNEYVIDGEYDLFSQVLIRRPVVLLKMEYLKNFYNDNKKSLGVLQTSENTDEELARRGCKMLPPVPKDSCFIFDVDIEVRQRRLETLKRLIPESKGLKKKHLLYEKNDICEKWLEKYKDAFEKANAEGLQHPDMRSLCPVTWKALETVFAHDIQYRVPLEQLV